jgi:hypothetical protein
MIIYYLYVKTHNITGLKYLGQTSKQNPYTYCGSGKDWRVHLNQFGYTVSTEILAECSSKEELNTLGRYYSTYYRVTTSVDDYGNRIWANRIPETGGGGSPSNQTREKLRDAQLGRKKPPRKQEHTEKLAATVRGRPNPKTSVGLRKYYDSNPDRGAIIEKQAISLKEWYKHNLDKASDKANKTWDIRIMSDYEKYKEAVSFIAEGKTNRQITNLMKIDSATINKLRSRKHRVFSLFPGFIQLMGPEVL